VSVERTDDLLQRYGYVFGALHLAINFTQCIDPAKGDPKKCTESWDRTSPLPDGPFGAALLTGRGMNRNPVVVLKPSGLIGVECDGAGALEQVLALDLPDTVTVQSSAPDRLHWWFRSPDGHCEYAAFRFEPAGVTGDRGRYLLVPPSVHPSGSVYRFLRSPEDTEIAVLPAEKYDELARLAEQTNHGERERLRIDPDAKILEGRRRESVFRFACMLRRWGLSEAATVATCQRWNLERCDPPIAREQVEVQVRGAMKKPGGQELGAKRTIAVARGARYRDFTPNERKMS
jgi:hypothetical protein